MIFLSFYRAVEQLKLWCMSQMGVFVMTPLIHWNKAIHLCMNNSVDRSEQFDRNASEYSL